MRRSVHKGTIKFRIMELANTTMIRTLIALAAVVSAQLPSLAEHQNVPHPYDRLNLSPRQSHVIQSLDSQWKSQYMELRPQLQDEQHRLADLLGAPKSDPLEITATQQRINHLKEQLSGLATDNYLRKRRVLNEGQRSALQGLLRQMLVDKVGRRSM